VAELGIGVGSEVHLILKSGSIRCEAVYPERRLKASEIERGDP